MLIQYIIEEDSIKVAKIFGGIKSGWNIQVLLSEGYSDLSNMMYHLEFEPSIAEVNRTLFFYSNGL